MAWREIVKDVSWRWVGWMILLALVACRATEVTGPTEVEPAEATSAGGEGASARVNDAVTLQLIGELNRFEWLLGSWSGTRSTHRTGKRECQVRIELARRGHQLVWVLKEGEEIRCKAKISFDKKRNEYRLSWRSGELGSFEAGGQLEEGGKGLVFWRRPTEEKQSKIRLLWRRSKPFEHQVQVHVDRGAGLELEMAVDIRLVEKTVAVVEVTDRGQVVAPSPLAAHRQGRKKLLARYGGAGTESAVEAGLEWLRDHQSPDGSWKADSYFARCGGEGRSGECKGAGTDSFDTGNTGLALLAFLGSGHTWLAGKYRKTMKKGLRYLKSIQDQEGCFGPREGHFMYNHTIASLAMVEAYGLTRSVLIRDSARRAIDFLTKAQNPGFAWRYAVQPGDNDSSVTGWAIATLHCGKIAGIDVPMNSFSGAKKWYDSVTDPQYYRTGYIMRGDRGARLKSQVGRFASSEAMTAVAIMARAFMGVERTDPLLRGGADLLLRSLPEWSTDGGPGGTSKVDFYYWYLGSQAMFQMGGDYWKRWNLKMKSAIVDHQESGPGSCQHGSWKPVGPWGSSGGRVYSTALNVLSLQTYYRYARVYE